MIRKLTKNYLYITDSEGIVKTRVSGSTAALEKIAKVDAKFYPLVKKIETLKSVKIETKIKGQWFVGLHLSVEVPKSPLCDQEGHFGVYGGWNRTKTGGLK